ncbi:Heavy-metal-associated domain family protein [Clavispora lusitaniae]|uniref:Superoxide dismutase 1 copper chaperone n=2 Tax=Clavispora lusitaniae TaxID=36911 RepID=C4Y533_CLAL4|nr:uncharacterized protein CLUG_03267 [Clavispora lusitaniae ATCC 42720]EEQ39139.1 hypothetical protein CLUG_03267 [Clavispora lusitaniae ATCC 42720]KAF5210074.1 copper chaperone [Clavispora lusitaniae]KAF7582858.1 Heavy-metal-associated domain family protein [Clavispora lusitaniae]OVF11411.1 putative superoxide dismutase 1 copper chaperone [Clavispora lusitaniae]
MTRTSFETVFNVPLECQSCVDSVDAALKRLKDIESFNVDLKSETVTVMGNLPPSEIVKAIQATGKDAIIRGTGKPNSAAVCILESFDPKDKLQPVKGLARIVAVSDSDVYVDLTVNGLPKGTYYPSIRKSGNLSLGALSTGGLFHAFAPIEVDQPSDLTTTINSLGAFNSDKSLFSGQSFLHANLKVQDLIGRSMILSKLKDDISKDALCGVIARSAGAWENDKSVCSCTGKTVWQERVDAVQRGVTS